VLARSRRILCRYELRYDMRSSGKEFTIEVLHFVSELKAAVTLLPGAVGCVQPAPVEMRRSGRVARYHNSAQHGVCASNYLRRDVRLAPSLVAPGSETRSCRSRASWPGSPRAGFRGCREPQCFLPAPSPGLVTGEEMRRRAEGRDHGLLRRNRDGVATMFECSASWPSGYRARR
jgi:hypothetical protein